jgi:hypothetical protein
MKMMNLDLYTKAVLTIIAACLFVLCIEQSHWNRLNTVQAQGVKPQEVVISGYVYDLNGQRSVFTFGNTRAHGIPVVVQK